MTLEASPFLKAESPRRGDKPRMVCAMAVHRPWGSARWRGSGLTPGTEELAKAAALGDGEGVGLVASAGSSRGKETSSSADGPMVCRAASIKAAWWPGPERSGGGYCRLEHDIARDRHSNPCGVASR